MVLKPLRTSVPLTAAAAGGPAALPATLWRARLRVQLPSRSRERSLRVSGALFTLSREEQWDRFAACHLKT
jgi:hypothetical protein